MTAPSLTLAEAAALAAEVLDQVERAVIGKRDALRLVLAGVLAGGHVLIEDLPGLGKTVAAHSLATALGLTYTRAQFTPDLLPSDLTGGYIYDQRASEFVFRPGPVFTGLLLADEINRTPPKTQSALLEAMQEKSVSVGRQTYRLELPFFVMATQNPLEMEGTYPLPEAQLDRFFVKLKVVYPALEELHDILDRTTQVGEPEIERVLHGEEILQMRTIARAVPIARPVQEYAIRLTLATHPQSPFARDLVNRYVRYGASPRGAQALVLGGKIRALLHDRRHVSCEDIRAMALPALRHRVLLNFEGEAEQVDPDTILQEILAHVQES